MEKTVRRRGGWPKGKPRGPRKQTPLKPAAVTVSALEAVTEAMGRDEPLESITDEVGAQFIQRPITLDASEPAPPVVPGRRVRVYHKRNTTMFLTDCQIGPNEDGEILYSDSQLPQVAPYIVLMS